MQELPKAKRRKSEQMDIRSSHSLPDPNDEDDSIASLTEPLDEDGWRDSPDEESVGHSPNGLGIDYRNWTTY